MRRTVALFVLMALTTASACGGHSAGATTPGRGGNSSAQQELAYGRAPTSGGGITYKPDVVIVGGGAGMVKSVSGDSLTWTIDSRAPHLRDLRPGKVMFLTGRAVGRVLKLAPHANTVAVTLGPVDLTDVISDGNIKVHTAINSSAMSFQTFPGVPGVSVPAKTGTSNRPAPRWAMPAAYTSAPGEALPPPTLGTSTEVSVGDFAVELGRKITESEHEFSLKVGYTKKGVTVGLEFAAKLDAPTVDVDLALHGGALTRKDLRLDGLKELSVRLVSGSETGLAGNFKSRVEVPAEMTFPLPAGPVPLVASIRFKFIVETAFSARNATLKAVGKLVVAGPLGFAGGTLLTPTVTPTQTPADNVTGVSVGVNGVVIALQMKLVIGLGIPAALAGPFAAVTVSYGITNGSAIGIVQCRQSSLDVVLAGGVGFTIAPGELKIFELLEGLLSLAPKLDSEYAAGTTSVVHRTDYQPKVAVCRA
ncbi:MAG: hypothetical protein WCB04_14935 [Mycobacteriales bacterium]